MRVRVLGAEICAKLQCGPSYRRAARLSVLLLLISAVFGSPAFAQGTPWALPGGIQAEDFDTGGQDVGYHDNSPGNNGGAYRSTDVDIASTSAGGYAVGWIDAGEWLRYTINVSQSGNYNIVARVASAGSGGTFHIEFNGVNKTGSLRVPDTGGWQSYQDLAVVVSLDAGVQSMRVVFDTVGSTNAVGNVSYIRFDLTSAAPGGGTTGGAVSSPFGGSARAIPGTVQAEDFDHGGSGVGYRDNSAGNSGGAYRSTDVDIALTPGGVPTVGWVGAGEWLQYTVNVSAAGNYTLVARVASAGTGGTFHVEFKGQDKTGALRVPNTGGWGTYQDLTTTVSLEAGQQTMRLVFDSNGSTGAIGNLNYVRLDGGGSGGGSATPPPSSGTGGPYGGSARAIPGGIQAEDFDQGGEGVAYHDETSGNAGGVYRSTDVDIAQTNSGGYAVGWVRAGEWLRYTVNVTAAGDYTMTARMASPGGGGTFHIEFNGQDKTGAVRVPATGDWTTYQDVRATVTLDAGVQSMRIVFDSAGSTGSVGNVSYLQFDSGSSAPPPPPPSGGSGGKLRVLTWNIHFGNGDTWGQAQEIASSGAHVALLQEASTYDEDMPRTYADRLRQLTGYTWYSSWGPMYPGAPSQGTLILSRYPIVDKRGVVLSGAGIAHAVIDVGGVYVNVFSVHLEYYDTGLRSAQLQDFMTWSRKFSGPRISGGDFNSWWGEWWIREMELEHSDTWQDVTGSDENGYTLNGAVRFDYLFRAFTDNWRLTPSNCWVQSTSRSDHSPVIAEYSVR